MLSNCCGDFRTKASDTKGHWAEGQAGRWQQRSPLTLPSRNCMPKSHLSKLSVLPAPPPTQTPTALGFLCSCPRPPGFLSQAASECAFTSQPSSHLMLVWLAGLSTSTPTTSFICFRCSSYLPQGLGGHDWELDKPTSSASCSPCDTEQATSIP